MITQDELFEWLLYSSTTGQFTWLKRPSNRVKVGDVAGTKMKIGYLCIQLKGQSFYAHRLAWFYMLGEYPSAEIDHVNMVKDDNRWSNLRLASKKQNTENRRALKNNTSGHMGVYWLPRQRKWLAKIVHNGRQIHLGLYSDKSDAVAARVSGEREFFSHAPERSVL